jgi:prepilin-type N-terminal cleavage/methylation domain-containing protein
MRGSNTTKLQRGFTLVELIITVVVLGILAAVGSSMFSDTFMTARMVNSSQASADQARYAMERLAREIREVKYSGNAYAISSAMSPGATTMAFTRTISGSDVTVTVNRSGTNLTLTYSSPATTSTLASDVTAFTLDFLQLDNTATTLASAVRFVVITVTVTDATSGQAIQQQTRVALRNA